VEAVIHLAAIGSVPMSIQDPIMTNQVNVDGTLNLLLAAREAGVRRFVFASSSAVYGDAPEKVKVETLPPRPQSPYAVQKLAAEAYCGAFLARVRPRGHLPPVLSISSGRARTPSQPTPP
jgi:nucleoside-diphosphate-sugar epimerase